MPGKFDSARDEFLHRLTLDGTDRSGGDVEAPSGYYSLVVIDASVLDALRAEHSDIAADAITDGYFLVREDSDGFVTVTEFDDSEAADAAFEDLETRYAAWENE